MKMLGHKTKGERILYAEERGNFWLAKGNEASEAGNQVQADECYEKGQFWLDRYNKLVATSN